jgi:hypothetical protein
MSPAAHPLPLRNPISFRKGRSCKVQCSEERVKEYIQLERLHRTSIADRQSPTDKSDLERLILMKKTTRNITYLVNLYCGRDERSGRSQEQSGHRSGKLHCSSRLSIILWMHQQKVIYGNITSHHTSSFKSNNFVIVLFLTTDVSIFVTSLNSIQDDAR